ncbi:hypothetical protein HY629_01610 [Candidatus Uhrbacteria bacterium]|nr:hypothetical protein [Candidatus Uhrbacteria bacterium]
MVIQWAHYQRNKPTQSKIRTKVFIAEPEPSLRHRYGRLFGVIELHSLAAGHLRFLHALVEELEHAYYPGAAPMGPQQPLSVHFENVLKKLNPKLMRLAEDNDVPRGGTHFSYLIGVLKERELVVTHYGNARVLLLHQEDERKPKLIDIIGASERAPSEDQSLFSSLLEGQLGAHDRVLVCTETLVDYASLAHLQELLATHDARSAVERLETLLDEAPDHLAFPVLVVELEPEATRERKSATSVAKLLETERTTTEILSPSFRNDVQALGRTVMKGVRQLIPGQRARAEDGPTLALPHTSESPTMYKERIAAVGGLLLRGARVAAQIFVKILLTTSVLIARFLQWSVRMILARRRPTDGSTPEPRAWNLALIQSWFASLSFRNRVPLVIGSLLLIAFIGSLVVLGLQRASARREANYQTLVKTIEDKKAQLEVHIIVYHDEEKARALLQELDQLLATFPRGRARAEKKQTFERDITTLRARLEKRVTIEQPERLIDLTLFAPRTTTIEPQAFVLQNNNMYVYGRDPLLFKVNADNRQAVSFEIPAASVSAITAALPYTQDRLLFIDDQNRLTELNPEARTLKPTDIIFGSDKPTIRASGIYNDRLYIVDGQNNQIYRHQNLPSGFGKGTPWLKESVSLSETVSMVIDGTVWILFSDGGLSHFVQGTRRAFTPDTMTPPLARATRLATTFESDYLTILDPSEKRIIVLRKRDGKLVMQYTSPAFDQLRDFIVDESKKTMYILNGTSIYTVPLQHL